MTFFWFCCILPTEKAAIQTFGAWFLANLGEPMPLVIWELVWSGATWGASERRAAAESAWHMQETVIIIPDEPPVPAIETNAPIAWAEVGAFLLTPDALCPHGCTQPVWL